MKEKMATLRGGGIFVAEAIDYCMNGVCCVIWQLPYYSYQAD